MKGFHMKQKCAKAAFGMLKDGMIAGLGGGTTVALLIEEIEKNHRNIQAVTPSWDTMQLCIRHHIPVLPLEMTKSIDIAFDGCDELDRDLNALKSCGGIHTREKITASMAKEYVLLADEGKLKDRLTFSCPVTVEVIRCAAAYVEACLQEMGAQVTVRRCEKKSGLVISDDGNYLMDAKFKQADDIGKLASALDRIPGIAGHSLFYHIASKAVIAKADGVEIIYKNK